MTRGCILFRADASFRIGTGHVRRCLAIADAAARIGFSSLFVVRDLGLDQSATIRARGHRVIALPRPLTPPALPPNAAPHAAWAEVAQADDAHQTVAALAGERIVAIVVDSYAFDAGWHEIVRGALAAPLTAIDDLGDRPLAADLVVDHNWHADHRAKYGAWLSASSRLLGGPRFALIDPAYAEAPRYRFSEQVRSIGIFMGGVDAEGLSLRVAVALRRAGFAGELAVATTSANPVLAELQHCAQEYDLSIIVDRPDLRDFFAAHDLQIGASGGATWERCCMAAPTLAIAVAENQHQVLGPLARINAIATVSGTPDPDAIAAAALALTTRPDDRRALAARSGELVDGLGAPRAALAILADRLTVRSATVGDGERMHAWRNDPAVRAVSRETAEIPLERHLTWLTRALADRYRLILVGEIGGRPIGVVRFDHDPGRDQAEVSIYLDPQINGIGLGTRLLAAAERFIAARPDAPATLVAQTLPGNDASARLFAALGYQYRDAYFRKPLRAGDI